MSLALNRTVILLLLIFFREGTTLKNLYENLTEHRSHKLHNAFDWFEREKGSEELFIGMPDIFAGAHTSAYTLLFIG